MFSQLYKNEKPPHGIDSGGGSDNSRLAVRARGGWWGVTPADRASHQTPITEARPVQVVVASPSCVAGVSCDNPARRIQPRRYRPNTNQ